MVIFFRLLSRSRMKKRTSLLNSITQVNFVEFQDNRIFTNFEATSV